MRFTTREDIAAPIEEVFAALSDFETIERELLHRGAEVSRVGSHAAKGPGLGWTILFVHRGRARKLKTEIATYDPPNTLAATGRIGGLEGTVQADLVTLAPRLTRMTLDVKLAPTTISSRLFVQSLKLARTSLNRRFTDRIAVLARRLEQRR